MSNRERLVALIERLEAPYGADVIEAVAKAIDPPAFGPHDPSRLPGYYDGLQFDARKAAQAAITAFVSHMRLGTAQEWNEDAIAEWFCSQFASDREPFHQRDHTGKRPWRQTAMDFKKFLDEQGHKALTQGVTDENR